MVPIDLVCHATGARGRIWLQIPVWPKEVQTFCERFSRVNDGHVVTATQPLNGERVATAGFGHSTLL